MTADLVAGTRRESTARMLDADVGVTNDRAADATAAE
jgi:hypothetical protein